MNFSDFRIKCRDMMKDALSREEWEKYRQITKEYEGAVLKHEPDNAYALSELGFAYSRFKDAESLSAAYGYYDRACDITPDNESRIKNRDITENLLVNAFMQLGKEKAAEKLLEYYEKYKKLADEAPEKKSLSRLRDRAESDLAFALCSSKDLARKIMACNYYEDLAKRHPEVESHARNLQIVRRQIAAMR